MKKNLFLILLLSIGVCALAQNEEKIKSKKPKILGIQINPYAKSINEYGWAAALRYAVDLHEHFTLGFELVWNVYDNPGYNNNKAGLSLFTRYNITKTGKLMWFAELDVSVWYAYWDHKEFREEYYYNFPYYQESSDYYLLNGFFAPGMRIPFAKNKLSFDLMLKMSNSPVLFDRWHFAPTFRFNLHF